MVISRFFSCPVVSTGFLLLVRLDLSVAELVVPEVSLWPALLAKGWLLVCQTSGAKQGNFPQLETTRTAYSTNCKHSQTSVGSTTET
jgi:hypothetical protein